MANIRQKTDIDRSYSGALKEINRLCRVVESLQNDYKFLKELYDKAITERNSLRDDVAFLKDEIRAMDDEAAGADL